MCLKLWKNSILFIHMCFLSSEQAIFFRLLVSQQMSTVGRSSQGHSQCGWAPGPHTVSPLMDFGGWPGTDSSPQPMTWIVAGPWGLW